MKRLIQVIAVLFGIYVLIGLSFDAFVGYTQPQDDSNLVIQTQAEDGEWIDTVLTTRHETKDTVTRADDELWVESGHWFRGWYRRLQKSPKVYVKMSGQEERQPYTAVPVDTDEAIKRMTVLMGKGREDSGYWTWRTVLLYAPIKPVRLDTGH